MTTPQDPLPPHFKSAMEDFLANYRVEVDHIMVRECADAITLNSKMSLQDNLNASIQSRLSEIKDLYRVVSINYSETEGMFRKNCALASVWFERIKRKT